jgi:hypothetical protein
MDHFDLAREHMDIIEFILILNILTWITRLKSEIA